MLTYRTGAAGTSSAAKAIALHLLSPTLPTTQATLASYYQGGRLLHADIESGVSATIPEVRRDINPRLEKLLGLSPERRPTADEIASLLAGRRADGRRIEGKQVQESKVALADEMGLSSSRLPVAHEIARVMSGRRADDGTELSVRRADILRSRFLALYGFENVPDEITPAMLSSMTSGKCSDGSRVSLEQFARALTSMKAQIGFIDFCWSADKSVSVAWALAPTEAERNLLAIAHKEAVASAMRHVEAAIGIVRKGKAGRGGNDPGSIAWIAFDHYTARPTAEIARRDPTSLEEYTGQVGLLGSGDPQLHTHVATLAVALTESGRVGTLDLRRLKGRIHEFGHIYQAYLATNLRSLGVDVSLDDKTGAARISMIPERLRKAFSKRTEIGTQSARAYARECGLDWDLLGEAQKVGLLKCGVQGDPRQSKKDDVAAQTIWLRQAARLNWTPRSFLRLSEPIPLRSREQRVEMAYHHGLNILEKKLANRAVLDGAILRVAAASGLVATGIENIEEIDEVVDLFLVRGVRQEGTMTRLVAGYSAESQGNRIFKVTTSLHAERENELVQLARASAGDKTGALNSRQLEDAIIESAIDFETTDHQRAQRCVMEKLAFGGRLSVAIGVAGSGKSTMILPLVRAWRKEGRTVWGAAIAWRQSADLSAAGIQEGHCLALSVFIDRVKNGGIKIGGDGVLVIDELGTVPTSSLLEILRLQKIHQFRVVAIGDPRQCQSIEAGPVVDILKQALGTDAVPELLSTMRQKTEREQKTTLLFRDGRAAEALLAKREDGTARLIAGDYERVVSEIAELWQERRKINQRNENWTISVSAPTNRDARAISLAIRKCRQALGEIGPDTWNLSCCDLSGDEFDLTIGLGDRVRLFKRVNARCSDRSRGLLGNNGSVLEVIAVKPDGITLRNDKGRIGHVLWNTLRSESGRILLSYGDVLTIDSSQGLTTSEHIEAMPAGTAGVNSFKAYTASSRHRNMTYLVASEGAERREITKRRPLGDTRRITESDVWDNIARNLSRVPETQGALAFLDRSHQTRREAAVSMLSGLQRLEERRIPAGVSLVADRFRRRRVARYMTTTIELLRERVDKLSQLTKALMLAIPSSSVAGSRKNQERGLSVRHFARMPGPTYRM